MQLRERDFGCRLSETVEPNRIHVFLLLSLQIKERQRLFIAAIFL